MMKRYLPLSALACVLLAVLWGLFRDHLASLWREAALIGVADIANELGTLAVVALGAATLLAAFALKGRWWLARAMPRIGRSDERDFRQLRLAVWLGLLSLPLITFGLLVFTLDADRQQAFDQGQRQVRMLSQVVAEQTTRTLHAIDSALRCLAKDMEMKRPDTALDGAAALAWMHKALQDEPVLRSVWVTDRHGRVVLHTVAEAVGLDASDRDYFQHHLIPGSSELYVGDLTRSRIDDTWFIPVSRRVANPDGSLAGVVVAAWEPRHFARDWAAVDVGPGGSVALFSWQAQLLMRMPYVEAAIGRSLADDPVFKGRVMAASEGSYRRFSPIDGLDRMLAFRRASGPPGYVGFIVVAGMTVDHILGAWRGFAVLSLTVWLVFTAALAIFGRILLEQVDRRAADALRSRDIARFSEDNPSPILRADRAGRIIYTNSAARTIIAGLVDTADRNAFKDLLESAAAAATAEHRGLTIGPRSFEAEIAPLTNATVGIYLIDTTERLAAIRQLRESEGRLALALETSGLGLFDLDLRSDRMIVNPRYASMLGFDPATFEESVSTWSARLHPDDRDHTLALFQDCSAGRISDYQTEYRQRTQGGTWKWLLSVAKIVDRDQTGTPLRVVGTHMDITDRKLREREREQNGELSQLLLSLGSQADEQPEQDLVSTGLEWLCRITDSQRAGLYFVDSDQTRVAASVQFPAAPWDGPACPTGILGNCLREQGPVIATGDSGPAWPSACVPIFADGKVQVIVEIERTNSDYDNDILNLLHLFADHLWEIIQHQRAEQALRDSESRLKAMTDSTQDGIIMIDSNGLISFWNPAAEAMFGYSVAEALGRDVHLFLAGDKGPEYQQSWSMFAETTTGFMANRTREVVGHRKDGQNVPVEITVSTFHRAGLWNAVGVLRDVSERKEADSRSGRPRRWTRSAPWPAASPTTSTIC